MVLTGEKQIGLFWHPYDEILVGFCHSYQLRIGDILGNPKMEENELRLRLLRPIGDSLPKEMVDIESMLVKTWQDMDKKWQDFIEVFKKYCKVNRDYQVVLVNFEGDNYDDELARNNYLEAKEIQAQAAQAYIEARKEYDKVFGNYMALSSKYKKVIDDIHNKECPNCPWNGNTIFPEAS